MVFHQKRRNFAAEFITIDLKYHIIMCNYNISIDDALMDQIRHHFSGEQAVQHWLEQQVRALVARFAEENKDSKANHSWSNYQLSPDIQSLAPHERKPIFGDYKQQISEIIEMEHQ